MSAALLALSGWSDRIRIHHAARLYALIAALLCAVAWQFSQASRLSYGWLWLELLLTLCVLFRPLAGSAVWLALLLGLNAANHLKIRLLEFPVTHQDLAIALGNPVGLFDALGMSRLQQYVVLACLAGAGCGLGWRWAWRYARRWRRDLAPVLALMLAALLAFQWFYTAFGAQVWAHRDAFIRPEQSWRSDELVHAVDRLSGLGFLAFSHSGAAGDMVLLRQLARHAGQADRQAVAAHAHAFFAGARPAAMTPNIVFVLAESTFDPNAAFRLTRPVRNTLFTGGADERGGQLDVTPVGGGTWKTEFETITGIDSRMFGLLGEYTHVSLSPYVKASFATYLNARGYETGAYYPVTGHFYGARQAYRNYGFQHFWDGPELGLEHDWTRFSDEAMAKVVAARLPGHADKPFFRYVVLLENHGPHPCREGTQADTAFADANNAGKQCRLAEYLRRAASSERGFRNLVARLRAIEHDTGRPFVAVVFGDHQPHSFVDAGFDANRTAQSKRATFYRIVASDGVQVPIPPGALHATLLPSIVSAAVARDADDLYMPEALYAQAACDRGGTAPCTVSGLLARAYSERLTF
jgi:hypothetical protein